MRFFLPKWLVYICIACIPWVVSACNQSFDVQKPASSVFPTPENVQLSPVVIPERSTSPINIPTPTITPFHENISRVDQPVCYDDMEILASFGSVPTGEPGILIAWPGEPYNLSWRIRNTGTCIWDSAYSLEPQSGDQNSVIAGYEPTLFKDRIDPGKSVTLQFNITAPLSPGDYPVSWILLNGYQKPVGPALTASIHIPADSMDKPLPTLTRSPNVQFEASSTKVAPYDRVALSWDVKQAKAVYFYPTGQAWVSNPVPLKGTRIYYPSVDTAFNLRVDNLDNTVGSYKIEVEVEPPLGLPDIVFFEVAPKVRLALGGCVDISWRVRGGIATEICLFVNGIPLVTNAERIGEIIHCPAQVGLKVYELIVRGPSGTVCKSRLIKVL
jgi:hypothetical protein